MLSRKRSFLVFEMLYSIKDREDLEKINELVTLQGQVKAVRIQDKLGKQNFHENLEKAFEPVTKTVRDASDDVTKTIMIISKENNIALESVNTKPLEIMNVRSLLAFYLMSALSRITNLENTTQFKLVKDSSSNRVNDLLIHNSIQVILHDNLLTFRDTGKIFEIKADLSKMITGKKF